VAGLGFHAFCLIRTGYPFPGGKWDVSSRCFATSNDDVKNARSYTITPQFAFIAWCLITHIDNLTFNFQFSVTLCSVSSSACGCHPFNIAFCPILSAFDLAFWRAFRCKLHIHPATTSIQPSQGVSFSHDFVLIQFQTRDRNVGKTWPPEFRPNSTPPPPPSPSSVERSYNTR
jgi:hypothetical protein